jgi:hypothetical protein
MNRRWRISLGLAALFAPMGAAAQIAADIAPRTACPPTAEADSTRPAPDRPPDVIIRASVTARTLRFTTRPRADVRAIGCGALDSVIVTERVNLPDTVEPGVTYRDVRLGIEIRSWLDMRCLLPRPYQSGAAPDTASSRSVIDPCALILGTDSLTRPIPR